MAASIASITQEEICVFFAITNLTWDKVYMHKQTLTGERWPLCSRRQRIESNRPVCRLHDQTAEACLDQQQQ